MVDPELRGRGIGKMLYEGRKRIVEKYGLKRIRAGARLRGYSKFSAKMSPTEYVQQVAEKKIFDPTLSFQMGQGFQVIDVAPNYLFNDPESLGYAAVIEWLNPKLAKEKDQERQRQSMMSLLSGNKLVFEHLPRELKRLVRKATSILGQVIKEYEDDAFFEKIEIYRERLKTTRGKKSETQINLMLQQLRKESKSNRFKIAHSFALQLEIVNACEAAYRTWRQRLKQSPQSVKSKLNLTFVLTAHPTESRAKNVVEVLGEIEHLLLEALQNNFLFNESELLSNLRLLWLQPISKRESPTVVDEAEYIFSLIFEEELFDFILSDKPSYDLKLRTWVGGDKDGHPYVNKDVMLECFSRSRGHLLGAMKHKLDLVIKDVENIESSLGASSAQRVGLVRLRSDLAAFSKISANDGTRIKAWTMKYLRRIKDSDNLIRKHNQILMINKILEKFPGLVFPIELREDAGLIESAIGDKASVIRGMLSELKRISGAMAVGSYARGLVISHCESAVDISNACKLVQLTCGAQAVPVIPLFETKDALVGAKKIIEAWFREKSNFDLVSRKWNGIFEVMLGYSDSSKQIGVLPSRLLIAKAMAEIEKTVRRFGVTPQFFHGSGGSVARGGGSLKEQIAWWPNSAIEKPKQTIQGEMIQRQFASKEILNSQCIHMATEAMHRKSKTIKLSIDPVLEKFADKVSSEYIELVGDEPSLRQLMDASPYQYLDLLKIGSRPSKRPGKNLTVNSLRAIPWVLCWTQTRLLMPTWWGIGTAWRSLSKSEKEQLVALYSTSPFFSSFVKSLGFTLSKVELNIWKIYFGKKRDQALFDRFQKEYDESVQFVLQISQQKELIWYRPWLKESIQLRSSTIHILNFLQVLSFESGDEALLRETIVGIACGMLTTG
jgi:phosphoenolpyruvate carboxylase